MNEGPERIDYQETPDVTEVHAAVKREHAEPTADTTPMPLWLTGLCGVAVAWAGIYFGIFHGGFSGNVFNEYASSPAVLFPLPEKAGGAGEGAGEVSLAQLGKGIYGMTCIPCHQPTGMGLPGQFPPLAGSEWVKGGEKRVLAIILEGVTGPITVLGKQQTFSGNMVAWEATLPPKKIAAVASYIRSEWGNGAPEITEADVVAAKKEFASQTTPWTEAQLLQIPADANFDTGGAAPAAPGAAAAPAIAPAATPSAPAPAANSATPSPAAAATPAAPAPAAPATAGFDLKASIERGKGVYMQTCIACHQITGLGLPGAFPPLAGTEYTQGDSRRMVAMTLKGVNPPLKIKDMNYVVPMPPLPTQFPLLADDNKLADVINYVRNSFGNKDDKGVTPAMIDAVRKEFASRTNPWTEPELQKFPPSAK